MPRSSRAESGADSLPPAVLIVGSRKDACTEYHQSEYNQWHAEATSLCQRFQGKLEIEQTVHFVDCRSPDESLQQRLGVVRRIRLERHRVKVPKLVFELDKALASSRYMLSATL